MLYLRNRDSLREARRLLVASVSQKSDIGFPFMNWSLLIVHCFVFTSNSGINVYCSYSSSFKAELCPNKNSSSSSRKKTQTHLHDFIKVSNSGFVTATL